MAQVEGMATAIVFRGTNIKAKEAGASYSILAVLWLRNTDWISVLARMRSIVSL